MQKEARYLSHSVTKVIAHVCNLTLDFGVDGTTGSHRTWSEQDQDYRVNIRVSFDKSGFWSLVGTDSVDAEIGSPLDDVGGRPHQRSLNLGGFTIHVSDSQGRRPGIYTYLAGFPNFWSKVKVNRNLRTQEDPRAAVGPFDSESV